MGKQDAVQDNDRTLRSFEVYSKYNQHSRYLSISQSRIILDVRNLVSIIQQLCHNVTYCYMMINVLHGNCAVRSFREQKEKKSE